MPDIQRFNFHESNPALTKIGENLYSMRFTDFNDFLGQLYPSYKKWLQVNEINHNKKAIKEKKIKCVYAVRAEGTPNVKIGFSTNLIERIATLQISSPIKISLIAAWKVNVQKVEKEIHKAFHGQLKRGEWFEMTNADIKRLMFYMRKYKNITDEFI